MLKAVKVRLYPSNEQCSIIADQIDAARYVYNRSLALRKFAYTKFGIKVGKFDLQKRVVTLKDREKTAWLKKADSQVLQQSISNMDKAYQHFFKGGGYPKFKSKHHSCQSIQYPQRVKIENSKIYLPKVGWVKCKGLREDVVGKIKTVTVSREANLYHAAILLDDGVNTLPVCTSTEAIGIDVGVSLVAADSNGGQIKPLDLVRELTKLRLRAQQLSRKSKGSKNRAKAKSRLAKQNLRIANMRKDFLHKLSLQYAENQGIVVVEDLKIKNMTKSAKGTEEKPGKNVKQKQGLNRSITQQSWGLFFELLEYKVIARGGRFIKVDPQHTSQTCNVCGHVSKENRLKQEKFVCKACGHKDNADVNAAKNIRDRGIHGSNASHQTAA
ncbi:transposase [Sulfuricurvum sp. IAE1]|uniref:RNA-guided endonuclease InsQ/TnpB family protein n=1 Tax=Sulfuricurvum sp. IAE1 TaxID=2546102 RepID=UPI00104B7AA5|nr:RNA-guided endonuclease TnpB family protein [Sulfuricurvum sp. IAE1]TDA67035.1 transposase [Sulfuricurvum sp. IAE1]